MFQFPRFPLPTLYIQAGMTRHDSRRVSPFGNLRFKACLAAPRSLSQPTTPFIGILRQGILYVRLSNFLRLIGIIPEGIIPILQFCAIDQLLAQTIGQPITDVVCHSCSLHVQSRQQGNFTYTKFLSCKTHSHPHPYDVICLSLHFGTRPYHMSKLKQPYYLSKINRGSQPSFDVKESTLLPLTCHELVSFPLHGIISPCVRQRFPVEYLGKSWWIKVALRTS